MIEKNPACFADLKQVLKNIRNPERLDDHPWTRSLIVQEALAGVPNLTGAGPGQQLVHAIAALFQKMQPPAPPRRGKRLDPRWGEFGLLAALYFTPFNHGTPYPTSLHEAWEKIDPAIFYQVYGKPAQELAGEQIQRYQLVGAEVEYGSASTLSDWHKKGLQRLSDILLDRERFLSTHLSKPSVIVGTSGTQNAPSGGAIRKPSLRVRRVLRLAVLLTLVISLILGGLKAREIYVLGGTVYEDVTRMRAWVETQSGIEDLETAGSLLTTLQIDLSAFTEEVRPLLWLSSALGWMPVYGGDIASAPELLKMAGHLVNASDMSIQAVGPLLKEVNSQSPRLDPAGLTTFLVQAQSQFQAAREELDLALTARDTMEVGRFSPRLRSLMVEEVDPVLNLLDEGLLFAIASPGLLGANTAEGPKTYLLLVENQDELRPTGGFITSVGNLVISNGEVLSLDFEEAGDLEDWTKPYPAAPWQLSQYMNSRVLVLRDSNWFVDFPTAALWAEYLYAYNHSHSVDGVIAFDQQFLVMLLGQIGPLEVEGAPFPITDKNVIEYMRQAKVPPSDGSRSADWYRKEFIANIANAVLSDFTGGFDPNWQGTAQVLFQALAERHLLLQLDDPTVAGLLAKHGWDNAVRPGIGDFLMVTDTNIGFNKTNAVVEVSLSYDVDLTDISVPTGTLSVVHKNNANPNVACIHWNTGEIRGDETYPINRCYWNYLRVFRQEGVKLVEAGPHAIPGDWMLLGQDVPAQVDELEEEIQGVRGFGTLLVVPGGQSVNTSFKFALPPMLPAGNGSTNQITYHLRIQKQPGTLAIPVTIRIHLPNGALVTFISREAVTQDDNLLFTTDLRTDVEFGLVFSIP